jgi:hypothetical protein
LTTPMCPRSSSPKPLPRPCRASALGLAIAIGRGFLHSYRKVKCPSLPSMDQGMAAVLRPLVRRMFYSQAESVEREPTPSLPSPHSASSPCSDAHAHLDLPIFTNTTSAFQGEFLSQSASILLGELQCNSRRGKELELCRKL